MMGQKLMTMSTPNYVPVTGTYIDGSNGIGVPTRNAIFNTRRLDMFMYIMMVAMFLSMESIFSSMEVMRFSS